MKRTVITTLMALAFITTAVAQTGNERIPAKGFAMFSAEDTLHPYEFMRHAIGDNDIQIEIMYAGICHSDLHAAWDEQQEQGLRAAYPMVYGSLIDGIKETQEMLDYLVTHNIYPEVEIIDADAAEIDKAWRNEADGKVKCSAM